MPSSRVRNPDNDKPLLNTIRCYGISFSKTKSRDSSRMLVLQDTHLGNHPPLLRLADRRCIGLVDGSSRLVAHTQVRMVLVEHSRLVVHTVPVAHSPSVVLAHNIHSTVG